MQTLMDTPEKMEVLFSRDLVRFHAIYNEPFHDGQSDDYEVELENPLGGEMFAGFMNVSGEKIGADGFGVEIDTILDKEQSSRALADTFRKIIQQMKGSEPTEQEMEILTKKFDISLLDQYLFTLGESWVKRVVFVHRVIMNEKQSRITTEIWTRM